MKGCLLIMAGVSLSAGQIATSPVRIDLSGDKPTAILTVTNEDRAATIIQVESAAWEQKEGADRYAPAPELLAVPPVFKLEAGEKQLIRVGIRQFPREGEESAYRLYLTEVPDASLPAEGIVRVLLRISLPLFVHAGSRGTHALEWQAVCKEKTMRLAASNRGRAHAKIFDLEIRKQTQNQSLGRQKAAAYILAGAQRSWEFSVAECSEAVRLSYRTEEGSHDVRVVLEE